MNLVDIRDLYHYNEWAHQRLLDSVATLRPEELTRDLGGSFKTIIDVEAHVISTEWAWLERWGGVNPPGPPAWAESGDMSQIVAGLREVEAKRSRFLDGLSDADLNKMVEYRFMRGDPGANTLQDLLIHVVNHSTYHRGQIASMIRQLGTKPPQTDFVFFKSLT
jgi:uncharacterized damage-inducible protein DinB